MNPLARSAYKARQWLQVRDNLIRQARDDGQTLRQIAAEVGLSPEGVNKILKREQAR